MCSVSSLCMGINVFEFGQRKPNIHQRGVVELLSNVTTQNPEKNQSCKNVQFIGGEPLCCVTRQWNTHSTSTQTRRRCKGNWRCRNFLSMATQKHITERRGTIQEPDQCLFKLCEIGVESYAFHSFSQKCI